MFNCSAIVLSIPSIAARSVEFSVRFLGLTTTISSTFNPVSEKPVTLEQIEADYDNYVKSLKWQLIENKLITENKIEVTPEEVLDYTKEVIKDQFARYGRTGMSDEELTATAKRVMENKEEIKRIYERIYDKKILDLFKQTMTLNEKPVSLDEFYGAASKA